MDTLVQALFIFMVGVGVFIWIFCWIHGIKTDDNVKKTPNRSFWVSKTRNGKNTWTHYRTFDTSKPDITVGMWIAAFILAFLLHTVFGVI